MQSLTLADLIHQVLMALMISDYVINEGEGDIFPRIVFSGDAPTSEQVNAKFEELKQLMIDNEVARLAEIDRVAAIAFRWAALKDITGAVFTYDKNISNAALERKRIIDENDLVALAAIEQADIDFQVVVKKQADLQVVIDRRNLGASVVNEFIYLNDQKALTPNERLVILEQFSSIKALLEVGNITLAKALIGAFVVDGITTQADKDVLLAMLAEY